MAQINPLVPQSTDQALVAELIKALAIQGGPIGRLPLSDTIVPVVNLQDLRPSIFPILDRSRIFSGTATAPAAGAILVDSGQLPEGTFDITVDFSTGDGATNQLIRIEHRNAANAGNIWLARLATHENYVAVSFAVFVANNERIRVFVTNAGAAGTIYAANIYTSQRVTA